MFTAPQVYKDVVEIAQTPAFNSLELYRLPWAAQYRFWKIFLLEAMAFVGHHSERVAEFGEDQSLEDSAMAFSELGPSEKFGYLGQDPDSANLDMLPDLPCPALQPVLFGGSPWKGLSMD